MLFQKNDAYLLAMNYVEKEYASDLQEIYHNINEAASNGEFYVRVYIYDEIKSQRLAYYLRNKLFSVTDSFNYKKDENGRVVYDSDDAPIKDKFWLDIFWTSY